MPFAVGLTFIVAPLTFFFFKVPIQHSAQVFLEKREEESNAI